MHILPLFEPELLHTDSYGDISQTHITGILKQNRARSVDFFMQVKQALRHFLQKSQALMTDMKLNVLSPVQIICMTEQFVQAQNKNNSCHVSFSSETLLTIADSKILKILRAYSKYHRHHDDHHHFYPLT